ncbi:hypothetical protein CCP3SC5AM1_20003 [Gammaproteobacteria bacterium]
MKHIDGQKVADKVDSYINFNNNNDDLRIGWTEEDGGAANSMFKGAMDDIRLYSRALTDADVQELFAGAISQPDFSITNIALSPTAPAANGTFSALVTVNNNGDIGGDAGKLSIWANKSVLQVCGAVADKSVAVGRIEPGQSTVVTVTGIPAGSVIGSKKLLAFIDAACSTAETDETNNQTIKAYNVIGISDFVVTNIAIKPAAPMPNTTFSVMVTIKNQGTAVVNAGKLALWVN